MKRTYGVSSSEPSNQKLKNGYTLYDWVMRQKTFPAFWGRTLLGENEVTEEEIAFLREKDCKIMLVIKDLTEKGVSGTNGTEDALRAIEKAKSLEVPQKEGIAIFAEIKADWSVNHNWMISFAQTLFENGYVAGFIGNTDSSKNFNFDRQCSHYVQETESADQLGAVYVSTEPKCGEMPEEWTPYCPSALNPEDMHFWSCGETTFDSIKVEDIYAIDEKTVEKLW